ncbi:MAG: hypothetical protein ACXADC_14215 [Candidatus Thorarchaeota archaeon]
MRSSVGIVEVVFVGVVEVVFGVVDESVVVTGGGDDSEGGSRWVVHWKN